MSYASIRAALKERVQTLSWLDPDNVAWFGTVYTPEPGTPYVAEQLVGIDRYAIAAGEKAALEWNCIYQLTSYRPIGEGDGRVALDVDDFLALFPRGLSLTGSDGAVLQFKASKTLPIMQSAPWVQGVARMPFFVHELPT